MQALRCRSQPNPSRPHPPRHMKLIIVRLGLSPKAHGSKVGDFKYNPDFDAFVLDGEALRPAAFNDITASRRYKQLIEDHGSLITVRVVGLRDMAAVRAKSPNGHPKPKEE